MHNTPHLQVVPTCTCPANRNAKDCCAGIMTALRHHPRFKDWYGQTWHKKELLARRHRADCDPFCDIAKVLEQPAQAKVFAYTPHDAPRMPRKELLTPESVDNRFQQLLAKAGHDQHLVSRSIPFILVYTTTDDVASCIHSLCHFCTCVHKN